MVICGFARILDKDTCICTKYNSYCYLDAPDLKLCTELYGKDDSYVDDNEIVDIEDDNIEDIALYDEEGVDDISDE